MDNIETAFISGGTVGIIAGVIIFLLKCLQKKKLLSTCCGSELSISDEQQVQPPPTKIEIVAPHPTPILESRRASVTPPPIKLEEKEEV